MTTTEAVNIILIRTMDVTTTTTTTTSSTTIALVTETAAAGPATPTTITFMVDDLHYALATTIETISGNQTIASIQTATAASPRISADLPIWLIPCYSIILLFAIIGNLLVISTLVQNRRMRTITNFFLLNLAFSDILLGVLCMPVTLVGTLLRHFIFGEILCKLIPFSQATSVAVSSWTLVAISCERYYAICHPLRSRTWQTINHAYKIIAFIWMGSFICMMPIAFFSQLMPTSRQGLRKCRELWPEEYLGYERSYNIFLDLALLVLPLMILCIAYILITRTLYIGMKQERAMIFGNSSSDSYKFNRTQAELATLTIAPATSSSSSSASSQFTFNTSFRWQGGRNTRSRSNSSRRNSCAKGMSGVAVAVGVGGGLDGGVSGNDVCANIKINPDTEIVYQQEQQQQQQHQQQQQQQQQHYQRKQYYDDYIHAAPGSSTAASNKRKMLTSSTADGRRHLYCMRTASIKSMSRNNGTTPPPATTQSMTVINVPQQQRFKLHLQRQQQQQQHQQQPSTFHYPEADKRKSHASSMRRSEAALRRSNMTKNLESKKRVVKMLFVLVLEFFVCWTPLYVINTVAMFIGPAIYEYVDYTAISFFQLLAYSSSCCNPITYCFMNAGFRRAFLDTFRGVQFNNIWRKRKSETHLCVAGNSLNMANSVTLMTNNTVLDSPRL